mmetsp:Transcript_26583/g.43519  ORF Transcript_26583/g.43519 Transcript_26583/m.43519 type:complete len:139 (-) Transcript_26583:788-1204(-)|eukprot:CAMPEP_0184349980 /NCGR_PEP_ID=MMETSP1089-20130417/37397_1 /TAXON_ID=38269 ORGANISM="Gloeochaete wittrockiana, Strain SAG46.84" /NCGR_SAMPLE_ID=MMETSP1089 /ASSEMBLY_ACC=CAM_ASM_000445 /LENGTH=138 /DNA_ID=CAMNT_0026682517 /DNA_START=3 /DNA_END=419 /DNA_ORIENTATION=+
MAENASTNGVLKASDQRIEAELEDTIESLRQISILVEGFRSESQEPLLLKLNALVERFQSLERLANESTVQVPLEVLSYVDDGRNPNLFTKDSIQRCIESHQRTRGKVDALSSFRKELRTELEELLGNEQFGKLLGEM